MMFYNADDIYSPTFTIFILSFIIMYSYSKNISLSILTSSFKGILFFIYFYFIFENGGYTFSDDWDYLKESQEVLDKGYSFWSLISDPFAMQDIFKTRHYGYHLFTTFAFWLFGHNYFSAVSLNIIITFVTSYYVYKLSEIIIHSQQIALITAVFFLFQWDLLTWSTMLNFKDIIIQLLILVIIYNIIILNDHFSIISILSILISFLFLLHLRFYLVYLLSAGYLFYLFVLYFIKVSMSKKIFLVTIFLILVGIIIFYILPTYFSYAWGLLRASLSNPIFGSFRFLTTPIAFNMDEHHTFLIPASFLHWLFMPFALYGIKICFELNKDVMILIFSILAIVLLFFGSYSTQQGPRHRLQMLPYIVIFQSMGFLTFFYKKRILELCKIEK